MLKFGTYLSKNYILKVYNKLIEGDGILCGIVQELSVGIFQGQVLLRMFFQTIKRNIKININEKVRLNTIRLTFLITSKLECLKSVENLFIKAMQVYLEK